MSSLVYVAGPLFSESERCYLERIVETLSEVSGLDPNRDFFLPHRDGGELGKGMRRLEIFELDMERLESAEMVVALLDGQDVDSGTCIELGYAFARNKKVFGLLTDFRSYHTEDDEPHRPNLMVWGICEQGRTLFHHLDELCEAFIRHIGGSE